jgi:putative oxidoreductase
MKIASTKYSDTAVSLATLVLRLGFGILMISHGFDKLQHFKDFSAGFADPFHIGSRISLSLVIFAEFFCACLVVLGLFTRIVCIPLIISCLVALVYAHKTQVFGAGEKASLYLIGFIAIAFIGPGKISMDKLIGK